MGVADTPVGVGIRYTLQPSVLWIRNAGRGHPRYRWLISLLGFFLLIFFNWILYN
jgi:hypothetical protein